MLRRFVTPRWLGLHAFAVLAIIACVVLALWQWDRAQQEADANRERRTGSATPLIEVLAPGATAVTSDDVARLVSVTGTYESDRTLFVTDRERDGEPGFWVLTPLSVDADSGSELTVLVVRGWVADVADATPPVAGEVEVQGRLTADDPPGGGRLRGSTPLPDGQVSSVNSVELAEDLDRVVSPGYVVLTTQTPPADDALQAVDPPVPFEVTGGLLQHWSYVAQWLAFAGFVAFVWWRLARDEIRQTRRDVPTETTAADAGRRDEDRETEVPA